VILQYRDKKLIEKARIKGFTNHRIGDKIIAGGFRTCGGVTEAILANADWTDVMAVQFDGRTLTSHALGPYSPKSIREALDCQR
jgi:hypothetical protein